MAAGGNLLTVLHAAAANRLDQPFLIEPDGTALTYRRAFARAAALAVVLARHGVDPGDRVVVKVAKSPDAVVMYLAGLHAGAVHVPLNPAFTPAEVDYFVEDADPALVIDDAALEDLVAQATRVDATEQAAPRAADDLAALLYTSGTTGRPKGAALTHANLHHNARALHRIWRFGPDDHLLHTLPIFHVHGLFVALHCAMLAAAPVTLLRRFDLDELVAALPHTTVLMGVPTQYRRLLADVRFTPEATRHVRLYTSGSAPLPTAVFDAFADRTGRHICERYGMSEAGIITSNPYDGDRLAGTVGFPLPGVRLRVVDAGGTAIDPGEVGEVEIAGPHLFAGYWRRPQATADAHRPDGYFRTGDVGSLAPDGRLSLQGRAGDLIISGGENVYPKEIELVLDTCEDITESAVIGVPHPDLGEAVVAIAVTGANLDLTRVRDRLDAALARFKHPKRFLTVDSLPRNAMGKVQKGVLRERYATLFEASPEG